MLQNETKHIIDATNITECSCCPLHYNCSHYMMICDFVQNKAIIGAKLLCILERAENAAIRIGNDLRYAGYNNIAARKEITYKDYLPGIHNWLEAFFKYEAENVGRYYREALILLLADSLDYYNCLEYFDCFFCENIKVSKFFYCFNCFIFQSFKV